MANYLIKHHSHHHHRQILPVHIHYPGNSNNESARVCYSIQNTSQNND